MNKETLGVVIAVKKQWWLKINTKPIRTNTLDGAIFPHIIKVRYSVEGQEYLRHKWINAGKQFPTLGTSVKVAYCEEKPSKAKVII